MNSRPALPPIITYGDAYTANRLNSVQDYFWNNSTCEEIIHDYMNIDVQNSIYEIFQQIKPMFSNCVGSSHVSCQFISYHEFYCYYDHLLLIARNDAWRRSRNGISNMNFELIGNIELIKKMSMEINNILQPKKLSKISWHYKSSHGTDYATMHVTNLNQTLHDEFYPWLPNGIDNFLQEYNKNSASVLILYGPPGTGKTSFLRHMLLTQNINAMVTYDESLLKSDGFFIDYLTDDEHNALIVEDADVFLTPRENGDNDMMNKFLNVSDGLIKVVNKKMIFTTNISDLNKIDSALLRPGRCYSCVEFRELTPSEAKRAAQVAGVVEKDWLSQKSWSLAQIFGNHQPAQRPAQRMGFV
jgi:hypothetical protein